MEDIIKLMDELKDRYHQLQFVPMDRGTRVFVEMYVRELEGRLIKKLQEK